MIFGCDVLPGCHSVCTGLTDHDLRNVYYCENLCGNLTSRPFYRHLIKDKFPVVCFEIAGNNIIGSCIPCKP